MKLVSKVLLFLCVFIFISTIGAFCQDTSAPPLDEHFNLFLFTLAVLFLGAILGASIIGSLLAILLVLFCIGMVFAGILSSALLVALYQRSVTAGFKSFLLLLNLLGGICISTSGLWLLRLLTHVNLTPSIILLTGIASGLVAGMLLSLIQFRLLRWFNQWLQKRLLAA